ncbi:MAG: SURF1 family protein [Pseudomonadota bacterium]|nr:SURF1 family protein [Pseudomonadota bacterium]
MTPIPFLVRVLPYLVALAFCGLFVVLGFWQMGRGHEKADLLAEYARSLDDDSLAVSSIESIEALDQGAFVFRRVEVRGEFDPDRQMLLDNRIVNGRVGFEVLTPLRLETGEYLIVNRGWVPLNGTRAQLPEIDVRAGPQAITGTLRRFPRAGWNFETDASAGNWPRIVQYPDHSDVSELLSAPVAPLVLLLDPDSGPGFVRRWQPEVMPPERHYGYSVQWFALALTVAVVILVLGLRRLRK